MIEWSAAPVHVRIRPKALHLRELGMCDRAIKRALGVSDKSVAKSVSLGSTR